MSLAANLAILQLSRHYAQLSDDCRHICMATNDAAVAQRIRSAVQELGKACIDQVSGWFHGPHKVEASKLQRRPFANNVRSICR